MSLFKLRFSLYYISTVLNDRQAGKLEGFPMNTLWLGRIFTPFVTYIYIDQTSSLRNTGFVYS